MTTTLPISLQNIVLPHAAERAESITSDLHYGKMKIGCVVVPKNGSGVLCGRNQPIQY